MANKQTRAYARKNLSTFVIKGAQVPKDAYKTSAMGESLGLVEFPAGHQPSKRNSKWRGHSGGNK